MTLGLGAVIFAILVLIIVYPSITLIRTSLTVDGRFSLQNFIDLIRDASTFQVLYNSLKVSFFGTIGATTIGVSIAWLLARTDVPFKRFWQNMLIVPYLIPPFIGAIAWVYLLGPVGFVNKAWMALTGSTQPLYVIYGQVGVILVLILYNFPIAYMVTLGPLRQMNPSLEEAARVSGANTLKTLRDIVIPLMLPSIGGSALLIFMSMMANFGIPAVIGFPGRFFVMTTQIYRTVLNYDRPNNLALAAALSMFLVILALAVMQAQRWLQKGKNYAIISGKSNQPQLVMLGKWKIVAVIFLGAIVLGAVIGPLLAILLTALQKAIGLPLTPANITLDNFTLLLTGVPKVRRAIVNSILLAGGSATVIVLVSLIISYLLVRIRVKFGQVLEGLVLLPYAIPGTVVALAMILAFLRPLPIINVSIYNTIWILLVAYIARFMTFGVRSINAAFEQVHVSLEEAARVSGAGLLSAFKDIVIPLIKTNVFAGWFLAFIPALTELTLSVLLNSVGNETLGVVVFGLHQEGKVLLTAALAFIVTMIVLLMNFLTNRLTRGQIGF
ncbi:MAG TPA: iron ABC transporter permease [Chloroflexi bacterium]|nr:iron ABC transporter permease [Chloroflexota bacterium]